MAFYQIRYLDLSGSVVRARQFEADNDEAAVAYADAARGLTPMELWEQKRKLRRWEAFPPID